mgnify:CR=1 FL=1
MKIREENFVSFAMRHYDNDNCESVEEFNEDLQRVKYVKRLLNRYVETGELKERLVLNHIVLLYNVFGNAATDMLFHRLRGLEPQLKPFLVLLNRLPEKVDVDGHVTHTSQFGMDQSVVDALRRV